MRKSIPPFTALLLLCAPVCIPHAQAEQKTPDNLEWIKGVEFGKGGSRALKMHILRPRNAAGEAIPAVVYVHGGGWENGTWDDIHRIAPLAQHGYVCASIEYRLTGEAIFPAQIEDCKCAIRFLRANAGKYNIDPQRIGVWGYSAGGHLVALLGTSAHVKELEGAGGWAESSSEVQAVCDFSGPADFINWKLQGIAVKAVTKLFGGQPADKKDLATLASPIVHITGNLPPFLIIHGDQDEIVPVAQAEALAEALKKAGGEVTLHVLKGSGHNIANPDIEAKYVQAFFDRQLKGKGITR